MLTWNTSADIAKAKDILVEFLDKEEMRDIFRDLGLPEETLNDDFAHCGNNKYADDMVKAWKKEKVRKDMAGKEEGKPIWKNLKKALFDRNHHGAVAKITKLLK